MTMYGYKIRSFLHQALKGIKYGETKQQVLKNGNSKTAVLPPHLLQITTTTSCTRERQHSFVTFLRLIKSEFYYTLPAPGCKYIIP